MNIMRPFICFTLYFASLKKYPQVGYSFLVPRYVKLQIICKLSSICFDKQIIYIFSVMLFKTERAWAKVKTTFKKTVCTQRQNLRHDYIA
jgi:hypothetical protein